MDVSLRSVLTAGVAAVGATTVALASAVAPPPDIKVAADQAISTPGLTQEMVDLLAAAQQMAPQVASSAGASTASQQGALTDFGAALRSIAPSAGTASPTPGADTPAVQNAASDAIDWVYSWTRYWANYVALDLGPWLIGWIPFGYLINDQIYIWYPQLVRVTDSFVYDFLDPIVNDPLNLNVWVNGATDLVNTAVDAVFDGGAEEINYLISLAWLPWFPPLPPPPFAALAPMAADLAAAEGILGPIGDLTDTLITANNTLLNLVRGAAETAVFDVADPFLRALRLGNIADLVAINYDLLEGLATTGVGAINDLIGVPNAYLHDVFVDKENPLVALIGQAESVVDQGLARGDEAITAIEHYFDRLVDYRNDNFPTPPDPTAEVAAVPESVRVSLNSDEASAGDTDGPVTTGVKNAVQGAKQTTSALSETPAEIAKDLKERGVARIAAAGDEQTSKGPKDDTKQADSPKKEQTKPAKATAVKKDSGAESTKAQTDKSNKGDNGTKSKTENKKEKKTKDAA